MRMQYGVFCERVAATETRRDFNNVAWGASLKYEWRGPEGSSPPEVVPFVLTLAIGFLDGSPGTHRGELTVRQPSGRKLAGPLFQFDWPAHQRGHSVHLTIEMDVQPRDGIWEFQVAVDGKTLGSIPFPLTFHGAPN